MDENAKEFREYLKNKAEEIDDSRKSRMDNPKIISYGWYVDIADEKNYCAYDVDDVLTGYILRLRKVYLDGEEYHAYIDRVKQNDTYKDFNAEDDSFKEISFNLSGHTIGEIIDSDDKEKIYKFSKYLSELFDSL